jgi:hypothetical protein
MLLRRREKEPGALAREPIDPLEIDADRCAAARCRGAAPVTMRQRDPEAFTRARSRDRGTTRWILHVEALTPGDIRRDTPNGSARSRPAELDGVALLSHRHGYHTLTACRARPHQSYH